MATLPSYQTVRAREDERAAAFLASYKDGASSDVLRLVLTIKRERIDQALTPYRPGLPPEALIRLHTNWQAYVEGREEGVVYDFYFDEGVLVYKLHEEPYTDRRPVTSFTGWDALEFRPWCATWDDAEVWRARRREQELTPQAATG